MEWNDEVMVLAPKGRHRAMGNNKYASILICVSRGYRKALLANLTYARMTCDGSITQVVGTAMLGALLPALIISKRSDLTQGSSPAGLTRLQLKYREATYIRD